MTYNPRPTNHPAYYFGVYARELLKERELTYAEFAQRLTNRSLTYHSLGAVQARLSGAVSKAPMGHELELWMDVLDLDVAQRAKFRRLAYLDHIPPEARTLLAEAESRLEANAKVIRSLEAQVQLLTSELELLHSLTAQARVETGTDIVRKRKGSSQLRPQGHKPVGLDLGGEHQPLDVQGGGSALMLRG